MKLNLKYKPAPENAPAFAADTVATAQKVSGVTLDYSVSVRPKPRAEPWWRFWA